MPEEYTEEQTRDVFADLHTTMLTRVRPPGTEEAMRTVRSRRRTAVAMVAAGVGTVLAGGIAFAGLGGVDRSAPPPAAHPSRPVLSDAELDRLYAAAQAKLGIPSVLDNRQRREEGKDVVAFFGGGPLKAGNGGHVGGGSNMNKTGEYTLDVLCVGEGTVEVHFWTAAQGQHGPARPRPVRPRRGCGWPVPPIRPRARPRSAPRR